MLKVSHSTDATNSIAATLPTRPRACSPLSAITLYVCDYVSGVVTAVYHIYWKQMEHCPVLHSSEGPFMCAFVCACACSAHVCTFLRARACACACACAPPRARLCVCSASNIVMIEPEKNLRKALSRFVKDCYYCRRRIAILRSQDCMGSLLNGCARGSVTHALIHAHTEIHR